ncbi:MAG: hypothetical protein F4Z00_05460 [Acidimicrobiaceae bacterium]|nr:hypothetical protein [Acidimicrobiaceae bacterium]MXY11683.1 hypothetical protein [Acidimicrobiaceae bacterium]MXZ64980.1 hypothetical protein [Acidimicrobiaceae bacterium]MYE65352.1 hypothetical protein [Acidimicrobiaceae bacterium]MYF33289.1 hypothetical protein [Acidimicrobiaceae bacterium]
MTTSEPPPTDPASAGDATEANPRRSRLRLAGKWMGGLFVAGSFVFWAWAFSPWARTENPGRLDDRSFVGWADQRCARAQTAIDALPTARQAASRAERADQVDRATDEVEALVADIRLRAEASLSVSTESDGPPDTELVAAWLEDWDVYISDRRSHSERLRTASEDTPDRELRFLLLDLTEGSTYTERMDGFARLNNMDNCQVPGDV